MCQALCEVFHIVISFEVKFYLLLLKPGRGGTGRKYLLQKGAFEMKYGNKLNRNNLSKTTFLFNSH